MSNILIDSFKFGQITPACYNGGTAGLYTKEEIDDLVNNQSYIPVSSGTDLESIKSGLSETMAVGTCWEGSYTTGGDKKYIQVSSIDLAAFDWTNQELDFSGTYDGNNLQITNFYSNDIALFRAFSGIARHIDLSGELDGTDGSNSGTSLLAGICSGEIYDSTVSGNVTVNNTSNEGIGGFVGQVTPTGIVESCVYSGNVNGGNNASVGSFVGINEGLIEVCSANGDVNQNRAGSNCFLGGFVGVNQLAGVIKECSFLGDVDNTNADTTCRQMGGFVGSVRGTSQIVNCYARGSLNGGSVVGGFCGNQVNTATIVNSYCAVAVTFTGATVGGFLSSGSGVSNSYYDSDVSLVSGGTGGTAQTTVQLKAPTSATGIYAAWDADAWDFGTSSEYPNLSGAAVPLPDGSVANGVMIVELGQSNMAGRSGDSPLDTSPSGTAYFWDGANIVNLISTRGSATLGSHATYFANRLHNLSGKRPIMVLDARSGAGLTTTSKADPDNFSATGDIRTDVEGQITDVIAAIPNITAPTCALWCQGERDAQEMDSNGSYTPAIVEAAMQDVIDWWKLTYPGVPFLISQTGTLVSGDTTGFVNMRQIQTDIVAANTDVYMAFTGAVNFPAQGKMVDNIHYNFEGLEDMGVAFANELNTLI